MNQMLCFLCALFHIVPSQNEVECCNIVTTLI